jgi:hypothetical protein
MGVRVGLNLNPTSVIFTSKANGGKSTATVEGGFITPSEPDQNNPAKLTLISSDQSTPTLEEFYVSGDKIAIKYSGATTGDNQYISAVTTTDDGGSYDQYAKLVSTQASGTANSTSGAEDKCEDGIKLSSGNLDDGAQTILLYGEQANGDGYTDYASDPESWKGFKVSVGGGKFTTFDLGEYTNAKHRVVVDNQGTVKLSSSEPYAQTFKMLPGSEIEGSNSTISGSLNIYGSTTVSGTLSLTGKLDFILPEKPEGVMLTTNTDLDLSSTKIGIDATLADLNSGDTVDLISSRGITNLVHGQIASSGLVDINAKIALDSTNTKLQLTIEDMTPNINSKAPAEGIAATLAALNQSQDLANTLIQDCKAANPSIYPSIYAVSNFGKHRYSTGSHIDLKGGGIAVGLTKSFHDTLAGIFAEFGNSDFDSYNGSYHGYGDSKYYGAGILANYHPSNIYLEGSIKTGKVKTNWHCDHGGYSDKATYLGAHAGVGYKIPLSQFTLDLYGKYLFSHLGSMKGTLSGLHYNFASASSNRVKLGVITEYGKSIKPYLGLALEHEFSGGAKATITNLRQSIDAPTLKGNTGVLEIGCSWNKNNWHSRLGLEGSVGKRQGISGVVRVGYGF